MITQFKDKLKAEGRSIKWFHRKYIKGMTYNALALQINGYVVVSTHVKQMIRKYMED